MKRDTGLEGQRAYNTVCACSSCVFKDDVVCVDVVSASVLWCLKGLHCTCACICTERAPVNLTKCFESWKSWSWVASDISLDPSSIHSPRRPSGQCRVDVERLEALNPVAEAKHGPPWECRSSKWVSARSHGISHQASSFNLVTQKIVKSGTRAHHPCLCLQPLLLANWVSDECWFRSSEIAATLLALMGFSVYKFTLRRVSCGGLSRLCTRSYAPHTSSVLAYRSSTTIL